MPHGSRIPNGLWGVQLLPLWVSNCYLFSSGLEPSSGPSPSVREFHPLGPAGPPPGFADSHCRYGFSPSPKI